MDWTAIIAGIAGAIVGGTGKSIIDGFFSRSSSAAGEWEKLYREQYDKNARLEQHIANQDVRIDKLEHKLTQMQNILEQFDREKEIQSEKLSNIMAENSKLQNEIISMTAERDNWRQTAEALEKWLKR